jgi:hypothetical protein
VYGGGAKLSEFACSRSHEDTQGIGKGCRGLRPSDSLVQTRQRHKQCASIYGPERQPSADHYEPGCLSWCANTVTGSNTRKQGQTGTGYLRSRCHQPKKNHVCSAEKRPKQGLFHVPDATNKPYMYTVPDPIQVPVWFMELDQGTRSDILTFVWGIERAGIEWTQEILFQMMSRHNLTPNQAAGVIKLFCNGMPNDNHPLCALCGFPALDDDSSKLIACTVCAKKHCRLLCGADAGWKCDACSSPATGADASGA